MKKAVWSAAAAAAILMCSTSAQAQTLPLTQQITATAVVGNQAKLTLTGSISFADAEPDATPVIPNSGTLSIEAKARVAPTTNVSLTVQAGATHFDPSTSTIPVGALKWTSSGAPFTATGTMSSVGAQSVGAWQGPASHTGTQSYTLDNSWAYAPGTHTVTLTYTLSTP
jgi:hypothetical protein